MLNFWFGAQIEQLSDKSKQNMWYRSTSETDAAIKKRFSTLHSRAAGGELDDWAQSPQGALALIILLDQMSRNLFRGSAKAFAFDTLALHWCRYGLEQNYLQAFTLTEKLFFVHPLEHSESLADQEQFVRLMLSFDCDLNTKQKAYLENSVAFAKEHRDIVQQFGRFPHRNQVLGRQNTPEEKAYLAAGGKRFGQ